MWCFMPYHVMLGLHLHYVKKITSSLQFRRNVFLMYTGTLSHTHKPWIPALSQAVSYTDSCTLSKKTKQHEVLQLYFFLFTFNSLAMCWGEKEKAIRVPHMGYFSGHRHFPYLLKLLRKHAPLCAPWRRSRGGVLLLPASQKWRDTQTAEGAGRDG